MTLTVVHRPPGGQTTLLETQGRYFSLLTQRFGQRFLEYRQKWEAASNRGDPGDFPLSLDLAINSGCQLKCLMCPLPSRPKSRSYQPMAQEMCLRLLNEAAEYKLAAVTFGLASEPLLNPGTVQLIDLAFKADIMDIRLGTNGKALNSELIEAIIDSGLTRLEISLDAANAQTYSLIRPGGNYELLIGAIEYFLKIRSQKGRSFPLIRLSFLELPLNSGQKEDFLERWGQEVDLISIQKPVWFPGSKLSFEFCQKTQSPDSFCIQPWQRLGVDHLGNYWPCCSWYGENLLKTSAAVTPIAAVWRSETFEALRRAKKAPQSCRRCARAGAF